MGSSEVDRRDQGGWKCDGKNTNRYRSTWVQYSIPLVRMRSSCPRSLCSRSLTHKRIMHHPDAGPGSRAGTGNAGSAQPSSGRSRPASRASSKAPPKAKPAPSSTAGQRKAAASSSAAGTSCVAARCVKGPRQLWQTWHYFARY